MSIRKGDISEADLARKAEMIARIQDYSRDSPAAIRERLVARWKAEYPDAVAEPASVSLRPLARLDEWHKFEPSEPDEIWFNDIYHVTVRRLNKDPVFGSEGGMIQLGINTHAGDTRHDWREFQAIKNQLAGAECEAFELYPAESRLLDPSNYYALWCFPGVKRLKIGQPHRLVRDQDVAWAPQRALPKEG